MTELARCILAVFAESYPTSACYKGGRRLRKSGWERRFPGIATDVSAKNDFLEAVDELVSARILSARWKRFREGDDVEALYLENPRALFDVLGIPSPEAIARQMLELMALPEWKNTESNSALAAYLAPRLQAGHPVAVRDAVELADLARLFSLRPEEAAACPLRALSVRLYANSKRLEHLLPVADRLSRAMGSVPVSERLGLGRSYPEVTFALSGRLSFAGRGDPWPCRGQILTLPLESVTLIQAVELAAWATAKTTGSGRAAVLSIENKETFHVLAGRLAAQGGQRPTLPPGIAGLVYTAGHPNDAVKAFLRRCADAGAILHHYGDLDPDGILILLELQGILGVPVLPWLMNAEVHCRYAKHGYALDRTQTARLSLVHPDAPRDLRDLAREIGETGVGVEQEIIDVGAGGGPP